MTRHIFRLIWHRRRGNAMIMIEIFLSFLVLFALWSVTYYYVGNYLKPLGFTYENVEVLQLNSHQFDYDPREMLLQIGREIRHLDEVVQTSVASTNLPYARSSWSTTVADGHRNFHTSVFYVDDNFAATMGIVPVEGRWFGPEDDGARLQPIVINWSLREAMFGNQPALGQVVTEDHVDDNHGGGTVVTKSEFKVVGVVDNYRCDGEFSSPASGHFRRTILTDSNSNVMVGVLIKVRDGVGVAFEETLMKRLEAMAPGWTFRIGPLGDMRDTYLRDEVLALVLFFILAAFLVFNVALGLFGVLWYSISRRRGELGLRRAVGADTHHISAQILGESLMVATFGVVLGTFFAAQVPITGLFESVSCGTYILAICSAAILIYIIVAVCALYPSRLAARIQPAVALHDE